MRFLESRIEMTVGGSELRLDVVNDGPAGFFQAVAKISRVEHPSNKQPLVSYPMYWLGHGPRVFLDRDQVGTLVMAECAQLTIQEGGWDIALIRSDVGSARPHAAFNDLTAKWALKITTWREGWKWFSRSIRDDVHPGRFLSSAR